MARSFTSGSTALLAHSFSGPVLFESILVFSVSAMFSWIPSITPRSCTPERSDNLKQSNWIETEPVEELTLTEGGGRETSFYLGKTGIWLASEHTLPPPGRGSSACGEIWGEVPEAAAGNRLQNTRGWSDSSFALFEQIKMSFKATGERHLSFKRQESGRFD